MLRICEPLSIEKMFRKKSYLQDQNNSLKRCLSATDLTLLGIGGIIGAGIFILTGVAAATHAGPAVSLSYAIAGFACLFAALCYAELAASIGGAGSSYNYAYVAFGEIIAWAIGWDLLLEYGLSICAVAIGWSGYVNNLLNAFGITIADYLTKSPSEGGIVNLPAILIICALSGIIALGVKFSAHVNKVIVAIKLLTIVFFIAIAVTHVNTNNWVPFMPFGWGGVISGAALVFFAYIGFDAVSTAAEETIRPERDLSIGIMTSLAICTAIYIIVAVLLTGIADYRSLNIASPVAEAILNLGYPLASGFIALGAIAGLTSVILIFIYGLTRIFYAISRDGLLPSYFAKIYPSTQTPLRIIFLVCIVTSIISGFFSLVEVASLVNIGTLAAFILVCAGVLILRITQPLAPRPFKTPFVPWFPILGILSCGYLMVSLPLLTWERFIIWMTIGLMIYFLYGAKRSKLSI